MTSLAPERQATIARRLDRELDVLIDKSLDAINFSNADRVGPEARHQLRGLLRYYAKQPKPFTACVHDNTKRFGAGRVDKVCAVLKDIIRGTTHWRGHPELDHGSPGVAASDERPPQISDGTAEVLLALGEEKVFEMIFAAAEKEESLHV